MATFRTFLVLFSALCLARISMAVDLSEVPGTDSFSSDFQNPTVLALELGSNLVTGEVGQEPGSGTILGDGTDAGTDGDYFSIIVPAGHRLDQVFVNRYNDFGRGFAAYAVGEQFAPVQDLGGGNFFYPFADAALFSGATDFEPSPPEPLFIGGSVPVDPGDGGLNVDFLAAGSYSFLIQENQNQAVDYVFDFVVTEIPEPTAIMSVCILLLTSASLRRRSAFVAND